MDNEIKIGQYDHGKKCVACAIGLDEAGHEMYGKLIDEVTDQMELGTSRSRSVEMVEKLDAPERVKLLIAFKLGSAVANALSRVESHSVKGLADLLSKGGLDDLMEKLGGTIIPMGKKGDA